MPRRLLTQKKERWAKNRDVVLRGETLRNNIALENRYVDDLERITKIMIADTERAIKEFLSQEVSRKYFGMDASIASQARILMDKLDKHFERLFGDKSKFYVNKMVNGANKQSAKSLHSSLERLSGGLSIKTDILTGQLNEVVKGTVNENVALIKSVPDKYLGDVRGAMMRLITDPQNDGIKGAAERINKVLNMRAMQVRNKARNIAIDQTRKTYNRINRGRMEAVGIKKFEWIHGRGAQKPRKLHLEQLNGNIYSFDDLPIIDERTGERGIPGQAINCGCTMKPVIEFGD